MTGRLYLLLFAVFSATRLYAQELKPGFDREEYKNLLLMTGTYEVYAAELEKPRDFERTYSGKLAGLDNLWELWTSGSGQAAIIVRGSTAKAESWVANLYAAMVPARGELKLSPSVHFAYELCTDSAAAVHAGWLVSMAYLSPDIISKIDSLYKAGTRDILIAGHSQGGAIVTLLNAHLRSCQKKGSLPADLRFKTYASAAPKAGNLYFAYAYEADNQEGWAFNVVNTRDWVPEIPISVQTLDDLTAVNPFSKLEAGIKKMKFGQRLVARHIYRKLDRPTKKARKNYQRFLGRETSRFVVRYLPDFSPPEYFNSNNYVRVGRAIVLQPTGDYFDRFPPQSAQIFLHHSHKAYLHALEQLGPVR